MGKGNSLINLGDLSKPATVLIEKISEAVGALYKPRQIKLIAQAEADADIIKALAGSEISDIQQRALNRLVHEEGKKQENIEKIAYNAATQIGLDSKPEDIDEDWISHFFEKCRTVSGDEMQSLWSNLLAGEANKPGSFSKRTVDLVSSLDKADAHLFTQLCGFSIAGGDLFPIVFEHSAEIYKKHGINFSTLNHLDAIGLIRFDNISEFVLQQLPQNIVLSFFGLTVQFKFKLENKNDLNIGHVMLTKTGQQLAQICGPKVDIEILKFLEEEYMKKGFEITTPFTTGKKEGADV
jgi:hypothetical protein